MKTNAIKFIFFWLLLLSSGNLFAASPEAEFRKVSETWTLHQDGSQEYRYHKELTLFTHTAMNSTYGQTFITYNPDFQELKIHSAYVKQTDGTLIQTPANAFIEVLPSNAADAPAYNRLKEMVIVHTGLELGATVYLDYSVISKAGYLPEIDVCKFLEESSPIKEYTVTFNLPESKAPHYRVFQSKVQAVKSVQDGMQQLKWTFRNLPAITREREVSLQNGDLAGLLFTSYPSASAALQNLYRQFDQAPAPRVTALAQNLTRSCQDETEKIYRIQQYIQAELGYCPLTLSETGFRLRPATEVITTAYGTEAEKINLMTALLKAAGIEAVPAAAYFLPTEPDYCGLNAIQGLVVRAYAGQKQYWLSIHDNKPAAANCNFLVDLVQGKKLSPERTKASIDYQVAIDITPELVTDMELKATFSNRFIPYTSNYASNLIPDISQYTISSQAETTTVSGKIKAGLQTEQNYFLLSLPASNQGIDSKPYAHYNSSREKNLLLPALVEETYSYNIQVPENLVLTTPVGARKIENKIGSLKIEVVSSGSTVHVNRSLKLNKCLITPAEYPAFRELITEWASRNGKLLLFKSGKH